MSKATVTTLPSLSVSNESGYKADYIINVEHSPITSWVFNVSGNTISYNKGNLTYSDFVRYALLADGCTLTVKTSGGDEVTSGNIETGMTATAGGKTYTISLSGATPVPTVSINAITDDEIYKTTDTYTKTITAKHLII